MRQLNFERNQSTIKKRITLFGVGIHSGQAAQLSISPAPEDTGHVFRRGADTVKADVTNVVATEFATIIGNSADKPIVSTVEFVLSALLGVGIDNAFIDVDGPEVPIFDGSAYPIVKAINSVGISLLSARRKYIKALKPICVAKDHSYGELLPDDRRIFEATINFEHSLIGTQHFLFAMNENDYRSEVARARTFGFMRDVAKLWSAGYALGASLENTIVFSKFKGVKPRGPALSRRVRQNESTWHRWRFCIRGRADLGPLQKLLGRS